MISVPRLNRDREGERLIIRTLDEVHVLINYKSEQLRDTNR